MKNNRLISSITIACAMVFGSSLGWAQSAALAAPRVGIVKIIAGEVRLRDAQGERPLKSGDAVFASDRLISGKEGSASVVLRDGTTLVLASNSQLEIQTFAFDATTQDGSILVSLLQGSLRMLTGLIAKVNPDAIQVKT
ncbi:MAG: FecR domain-containing protein, partial [Burkholderiaceae bacterium]